MTAALRRRFGSPGNALVTLGVLALVIWIALPLTRWALIDATWQGGASDCRAASGACWSFIAHKLRFVLFGLYPPESRWRAGSATVLLLALIALTATPRCWSRWLVPAWGLALAIALWLMRGGAGLSLVPTRQWGGLPITLLLTTVGLALGLPLGVLLALGRRARAPVVRVVAAAIVETVRGVPLIAVLYVAALIVPLTIPWALDKLALAAGAVVLFAAAYLGEAVRAGLQLVARGQMDASLSLGMRPMQAMRLVVLPQALRVVLPSLVAIAVAFFQDTSLVVIIGLFDLLNTARAAAQDPAWLGFYDEAYVFVGALYFFGSFAATRYGLWLERRARGARAVG